VETHLRLEYCKNCKGCHDSLLRKLVYLRWSYGWTGKKIIVNLWNVGSACKVALVGGKIFLDRGFGNRGSDFIWIAKKVFTDLFFNYEKPALVASPTTCAYIITFDGCTWWLHATYRSVTFASNDIHQAMVENTYLSLLAKKCISISAPLFLHLPICTWWGVWRLYRGRHTLIFNCRNFTGALAPIAPMVPMPLNFIAEALKYSSPFFIGASVKT